jgi:hypothetical protein
MLPDAIKLRMNVNSRWKQVTELLTYKDTRPLTCPISSSFRFVPNAGVSHIALSTNVVRKAS